MRVGSSVCEGDPLSRWDGRDEGIVLACGTRLGPCDRSLALAALPRPLPFGIGGEKIVGDLGGVAFVMRCGTRWIGRVRDFIIAAMRLASRALSTPALVPHRGRERVVGLHLALRGVAGGLLLHCG